MITAVDTPHFYVSVNNVCYMWFYPTSFYYSFSISNTCKELNDIYFCIYNGLQPDQDDVHT